MQRRQSPEFGDPIGREHDVDEPGLGEWTAGQEVGLTGRHLGPQLVGELHGDDLQTPVEVWPTNFSGVARTSAAVIPASTPACAGLTSASGTQPSTCTRTQSPDRPITRAGVPAGSVVTAPLSGRRLKPVSRSDLYPFR